MASYNTVPAAEEPLLQPKKSSRKYVVLGAALASFALGALAVTAVSAKQTKQPGSGETDFSTHSVSCPTGMRDITGGKAYHWGCGSGCAGGLFTDIHCHCACQCHGDPYPNMKNSQACDKRKAGKWSHCDWVQSNKASSSEDYVGDVDSPEECIKLVKDKCEKASIANVHEDGDGKCYCQYGPKHKLKADNEGWMSCHLSGSSI
jgi:hypothetical protein